MATTNKGLEQPAASSTNWDVPLNSNFGYIDSALGGTTSKSVTGVSATPVVLTAAEYRSLILNFTGTLTANVTYQIPSGVGGEWIVSNNTTGAFTLTIDNVAVGASAVIPQGSRRLVYSDGTNVYAVEGTTAGTVTSVDVSGGTTGLTATGGPVTSSGTITLGGTLAVANGGTGATTAAGALTNIVGFTPVQQGGGTSMGTNKVYMGWNAIGMFVQVDTTSLGRLVTNVDATGATGTYSSTQIFAPGNTPMYAARAWVNFNGNPAVTVRGSGNVSSVVRNSAGNYTVNFITPMIDAGYCAVAMGTTNATGSTIQYGATVTDIAVSSCRINTAVNGTTNNTPGDCAIVTLAIFR